ncbi:hypothetical protein E5D57_000476 [Metarhizium anisopliae]|nr:hypothetical protein E5D57_000476 [Metarhizium anisopliae]
MAAVQYIKVNKCDTLGTNNSWFLLDCEPPSAYVKKIHGADPGRESIMTRVSRSSSSDSPAWYRCHASIRNHFPGAKLAARNERG